MLIALQGMSGMRPRVHARQLSPYEAQVAQNCKLWRGVLEPWYPPLLAAPVVNPGPIKSIYRFSDFGHWLHWNQDVDVVRGPVAGSQRLYWTGDGVPKFGNREVIAGVTTLIAAAGAGQNFLLVNNALGFAAGDSISVTLDSNVVHNSTVTAVQLSLNRVNLAIALPSAAGIGKAVVNNNPAYPHGSYSMGVPAPTNALTAALAVAQNSGTVVGLQTALGEATNNVNGAGSQTQSLDLVVDSQGKTIEFEIYVGALFAVYGVQDVTFQVQVFRDPAGVNATIFEQAFKQTFQGTNAANNQPLSGPLPKAVDWSTADGGGPFAGDYGRATDNVKFSYTPATGSQTYRLKITHNLISAVHNGSPGLKPIYQMRLTAALQNIAVTLNTAAHGLREGDRVQFGAILGTGTVEKLNTEPLQVLSVEGAVITVDAEARGTYTSGGTWAQIWAEEDLEARSYVYTYVASLDGVDMEGPPSAPSAIINAGDNQAVTLTAFIDPTSLADGRPYRALRVYRTSTGDETDAEYLFVAEIGLPTVSFIDTVRGTALGEVLPSEDWEPPPADLVGLIELPNGVLAGFRSSTNEVCLCAPYQPHAWPIANRYAMPDTTVALGAFGSSLVAASKGRPNVFTGADPATLSREHIEIVHPCLAKRGLVDMGYGIVYPTETGLCYVAQGAATIITHELFTDDQWKALNPASFVAAKFGERYIAFYDAGAARGGFILDPKEPQSTLVFLDVYANEVWSDPRSDKLYLSRVADNGAEEIVEWNGNKSGIPLAYRWRSKEFMLARPEAARVIKVDALIYPVQVALYADGEVYDSVDVESSKAVRCSDKRGKARKWEVEIIGNTTVEAVYVASSMERLTQYIGG